MGRGLCPARFRRCRDAEVPRWRADRRPRHRSSWMIWPKRRPRPCQAVHGGCCSPWPGRRRHQLHVKALSPAVSRACAPRASDESEVVLAQARQGPAQRHHGGAQPGFATPLSRTWQLAKRCDGAGLPTCGACGRAARNASSQGLTRVHFFIGGQNRPHNAVGKACHAEGSVHTLPAHPNAGARGGWAKASRFTGTSGGKGAWGFRCCVVPCSRPALYGCSAMPAEHQGWMIASDGPDKKGVSGSMSTNAAAPVHVACRCAAGLLSQRCVRRTWWWKKNSTASQRAANSSGRRVSGTQVLRPRVIWWCGTAGSATRG